MESTENTTDSTDQNAAPEEEKSPKEIILDMIYDKKKPREERAKLILGTLKKVPEHFYELDFFKNNYYLHILENFTQDEHQDIFKELTCEVIKDIKDRGFETTLGGVKMDLFETTFNGDSKNNFGVLNYLVKSRKFNFISVFLDCFIENECTDRLKVHLVDNMKRNVLHYLCYFDQPKLAYDLYRIYREHFPSFAEIDLEGTPLLEEGSNSLAKMFESSNPLKDDNYDEFVKELDKILKRDITNTEEDTILHNIFAPDAVGVSFVHNLCLNSDRRFIDYVLQKWSEDPKKFSILSNIKDMSSEMNTKDGMSHMTPISSVLMNSKYEMCKTILDHIVCHHTIKISMNQKDSRNRNIFHLILYNKSLSTSETLDLVTNYLFKIDDSMFYGDDGTTIEQLLCHIDKDGFIPIILFVSKIKADSQQDEDNLKMFEFLAGRTDFESALQNTKTENFVHPLILCIKSKLDHYFQKFLFLSDILRKGVIFCEKTTGRTSIEYAFESDREEFIQPILDALDKVDSFIIDDSRDDCVTLFDIVFKIVISARKRSVFVLSKGEDKPSHPTVKWIYKFADVVFNKTKDKDGNKAAQFLPKFEFSKIPEVNIPKPKVMKKMPPRMKKNLLDDYNKKVEEAKIEAEKNKIVKSGLDIYWEAFKLNEYISFPYLYDIMKPSNLDKDTLQSCLQLRKHPIIFEIILDHCIQNSQKYFKRTDGIDESGDYIHEPEFENNFFNIIEDIDFGGHKKIPNLNIREFFVNVHKLCLEKCSISVNILILFQMVKSVCEHVETLDGGYRIQFLLDALRTIYDEKHDESYMLCVRPLIDFMETHIPEISYLKYTEVTFLIQSMFKKLIFNNDFPYVLKLQNLSLKYLKSVYEELNLRKDTAVINKSDLCKSENEKEDDSGYPKTTEEINEFVKINLSSLTNFEHYNQINFNSDPESIIEVVKGFIRLGGFCFINIGFDTVQAQNSTQEQQKLITRLSKAINEFRVSMKGMKTPTFLHFAAQFKEYNDIVFSLFDEQTPLTWTIDQNSLDSLNLFEYSLHRGNVDLAMKMIETCDISKVISEFPLKTNTVKGILNSDHVFKFLHFIVKNKDKIHTLVTKNKDNCSAFMLPSIFSEVEEAIAGTNKEDDAYVLDQDKVSNIVYAYYQKDHFINKLDSEIELFNLLFYINSRYVLDELVKILPLDKIKELNSLGFVIGKLICYTKYSKAKINDNSNFINNIEDTSNVYEDVKEYYSKSNKIGNTLVDISEIELATSSGSSSYRGQTCFALKDALRVHRLSGGQNEDTVEYLCSIILDNPKEYELFYPEIVRLLLIFLPSDHKLVSSFLPDENAFKKLILFENKIELLNGLTSDPYMVYYDNPIRIKMWCSVTNYITSDVHPNMLNDFIEGLDQVHSQLKGFDPQAAEVYRSLLISMFAFPTINEDNLAMVLAYSGSVWKFMKMIFTETVKTLEGEPISEGALQLFDSVFKNKQYFINPLEGLTFNSNFELAQKVMKYAIDAGICHKLVNTAKKNDLLHVDYIVRNYGDNDCVQLWKKMCSTIHAKLPETNPHLAQVIQNCDSKPQSDSEMEQMIRLPKTT